MHLAKPPLQGKNLKSRQQSELTMHSTVALVLAGGRGNRMKTVTPKQYLDLGGKPVMRWCLEAFIAHPRIDAVRVVISPEDRHLYDQATDGLELLSPIDGGAYRQNSVKNGLESLVSTSPERVLIHDGARPFIKAKLIDDLLDSLLETTGTIPTLPIVNALKTGVDGEVTGTVGGDGLWAAQTPQAFLFRDILGAHRVNANDNLSDDSAVLEATGLKVKMIEGDVVNFKITNPDDLIFARRQLMGKNSSIRVGIGFDAHRFGHGDFIMLCGIKIPFKKSLVAHSDGDVGIHSVVDALLGAINAGDIGTYFPSSDCRWKNVNSDLFLRKAVELVHEQGAHIVHVDLTIICNQPSISVLRDQMRTRMSEIMGISLRQVSIKGKSTDGLGFTGREEGISAQAVSTICFLNA